MQMTRSSSSPSIHQNSTLMSLTCKMLYNKISFYDSGVFNGHRTVNSVQSRCSWMTANLLTLNSPKTEFLFIRLKQQLSKIHDSSLTTTHSALSGL